MVTTLPIVRLMAHLGHERFITVGHDRGRSVAHRLAVYHPHAAETLVFMGAVPLGDAWHRYSDEHMGAEAHEDLRRALHDPEVVHAMLEDYRAGLRADREADEADRAAGRKVRCPTLVVWASRDDAEELYGDLLPIWRDWADDVRGAAIDSGHHMAEEAPGELAAALRLFFAE